MNGYDTAFPRDPDVVAELESDGMLQDPSPSEWREDELEFLKKALDIKGHGLI